MSLGILHSYFQFTTFLLLLYNLPLSWSALISQASVTRVSNPPSLSTSAALYVYTNSTTGGFPGPKNTTLYYRPLYEKHYNSTPQFHNVTGKSVNPLIVALQGANLDQTTSAKRLVKRDLPVGTCAPGTPCTNGACCSNVSLYSKLSIRIIAHNSLRLVSVDILLINVAQLSASPTVMP
jgi:hypothetical protein